MSSFGADGLGEMSLADLIRFLEQPRENLVLGDLQDDTPPVAPGPRVYSGAEWMASITHASRNVKRSRKRVYTGTKWLKTISRRRRKYFSSLDADASYDSVWF